MRLLDCFSGAGGAAMGYHLAGFDEIIGIDLHPQPRYPFEFVQADALEFLASVKFGDYTLIAASPPCQAHSRMTNGRWKGHSHRDFIAATRELLVKIGTPYVIENVPGAPLHNPVLLCGTMFGLKTSEGSQLRRHRLFEAPGLFTMVPQCQHNDGSPIGVYGGGQHPQRRRLATIGVWGNSGGFSERDQLAHYGVESRKEAMGIDWMTGAELSQAIPPAFTEYIGRQLIGMGIVDVPCDYCGEIVELQAVKQCSRCGVLVCRNRIEGMHCLACDELRMIASITRSW